MAQRLSLEALFYPSSVAVVGASPDPAKSGGRFLKSFLDYGFRGRLYPVNKTIFSEVMGLRSYQSLLEIPDNLDLAMIAVPAGAVPGVLQDCAAKKVKFAILHGVGFGELGEAGRGLEAEIQQIARKGGVRFVGPNCMGICCPAAGINTIVSPLGLPLQSGPAAFFGQSGWTTENFIVLGHERGLGFSGVVSSGNQSDLDAVDYLEYFGADPRTKVIGGYCEGIKRGQRFIEAARRITKEKPVIIWKAGKSQSGARAVASHTGSLAGASEVQEGAFRQAGIIQAQSIEELVDIAVAFASPYLPQGRRVGAVMEAGGGAAATADACESLGLELPLLPHAVREQMRAFLQSVTPPTSGLSNPVDLVWPSHEDTPRVFIECARAVGPTVDAIIMLTYYPFKEERFGRDLAQLRDDLKKPIFMIPAYSTQERPAFPLYTRWGIPTYPMPERAARALAAMVRYAEFRQQS